MKKKILALFLILSIICALSSCKKGDGTEIKKASGEMLYFEADAVLTLNGAQSAAHIRHIGFELTEMTFNAPANIKGLKMTKTDDSVNFEFSGMKQGIKGSGPYNDSPALILSEILSAVQTGEGIETKRKTNEIKGKIRNADFTVVRDADKNIQEITSEGLSFRAVFSNYKSLEAEILGTPSGITD